MEHIHHHEQDIALDADGHLAHTQTVVFCTVSVYLQWSCAVATIIISLVVLLLVCDMSVLAQLIRHIKQFKGEHH